MTEKKRTQLNLRLDGKDELLEAVKAAAKARDENLNAYCVRVLAESVGMSSPQLDTTSTARHPDHVSSNLSSEILEKVGAMITERLGDIQERLAELERRDAIAISQATSTKDELESTAIGNLQAENETLKARLDDIGHCEATLRERLLELERELADARSQLSQTALQESEFMDWPAASDLLSKLRAKRKKTKADLQDVEAILELLPEIEQRSPLPDLYIDKKNES